MSRGSEDISNLMLNIYSLSLSITSPFPDFNATCIDLNISDNCMLLTGYMALYKVMDILQSSGVQP